MLTCSETKTKNIITSIELNKRWPFVRWIVIMWNSIWSKVNFVLSVQCEAKLQIKSLFWPYLIATTENIRLFLCWLHKFIADFQFQLIYCLAVSKRQQFDRRKKKKTDTHSFRNGSNQLSVLEWIIWLLSILCCSVGGAEQLLFNKYYRICTCDWLTWRQHCIP